MSTEFRVTIIGTLQLFKVVLTDCLTTNLNIIYKLIQVHSLLVIYKSRDL